MRGDSPSWSITKQEVLRYTQIFQGVAPGGRLGGKEARPILLQYGLPKAELRVVWDLSDLDRDGSLTLPEFAIAMHVIAMRIKGLPLPQKLPPDLVASIKVGGVEPTLTQQSFPKASQPSGDAQPFISGVRDAPPCAVFAAAAAAEDEFGEFGDFEIATFENEASSKDAAFSTEWQDSHDVSSFQDNSDPVSDLFASATRPPAQESIVGGQSATSPPASKAPLTAAQRAAQVLDAFQTSAHEESKPKPKMADLMRASPKHRQPMQFPPSPPPSAGPASSSKLFDVFSALVEEDLGIKTRDEPAANLDTAAPLNPIIDHASGVPALAVGDASVSGWGTDAFGADEDEFGEFGDGTMGAAGDEDFGDFGPKGDIGVADGGGIGVGWGDGGDSGMWGGGGAGGLVGSVGQQDTMLTGVKATTGADKKSDDAGFVKGETVVYRRGDGSKTEALIVSVDHSLHPPSYVIRVDGRERETERGRLQRPEEVEFDEFGATATATAGGAEAAPGSGVWAAMGTGVGGGGLGSSLEQSAGQLAAGDDAWGGFDDEAWGGDGGKWGAGAGQGQGQGVEESVPNEMYADDHESVTQLMEMGFSRKRVLTALDECNWDLELATDWLLERIGTGDDDDDGGKLVTAPTAPDTSPGPVLSARGAQPALPALSRPNAASSATSGVDLMDLLQPAQTVAPSDDVVSLSFSGLLGDAAAPALEMAGAGMTGSVESKTEVLGWRDWGGGDDAEPAADSGLQHKAAVGVHELGGRRTAGGGGHVDSDDDFGDFEEYKGDAELPEMEAMPSFSLAGAGGEDGWGGFGMESGTLGVGPAGEAPKLVGLDEDPFADLIGSGITQDNSEGEGEEVSEETPALIFGNVDISTVVSGPSLVAPAAAETAVGQDPVTDEQAESVVDHTMQHGSMPDRDVADEDEFGEVDWGAAQSVASTPAVAVAVGEGEWGADDGWEEDGGGWGQADQASGWGEQGTSDLADVLGETASAAAAGWPAVGSGGGEESQATAGGTQRGRSDGFAGFESDVNTTAGPEVGGGSAALLSEVDPLGGMSGWTTGPGESLLGVAVAVGRKLSVDLMDMTAEPTEGVPVSLGWGLGLGGEDGDDDDNSSGLGTVLQSCTAELKRGRAVVKELSRVADEGECDEGGRLSGLLGRAELREYVRQLAACYRVGVRVGMALRQEGLKRRAVEELLSLGGEVQELIASICGEWSAVWKEEAEGGIGKVRSGDAEAALACQVCRVELAVVADSEAVVEWEGCRFHSACINFCLNCAPAEILPALASPQAA